MEWGLDLHHDYKVMYITNISETSGSGFLSTLPGRPQAGFWVRAV
jgi:hypothetical protein